MTSLVKAVNRKVSEFEKASKGCTKINALVLTSLDLCDENRRLKAKEEALRGKVAALKRQLAQVKKEQADGDE